MEKFKKFMPLILGAVITVIGIVLAVTSYVSGDYKNFEYGYALVLLFFGVAILLSGIKTAFTKKEVKTGKSEVYVLAQAALCAALSFIGCTYLKIQIPVPGTEGTMFHLGNVFCVLAALLLGGFWGGMSGAIGMSLSDLLSGIYITTAPKTFVLKLCIGLIVGAVAHKGFQLSKDHERKFVVIGTIVSAAAGMIFNIIAEPIVGYFYKMYLFGIPQDLAATLAKLNLLTTGVNAVIAVIVAAVVYLALRPVLRKANLFKTIEQ